MGFRAFDSGLKVGEEKTQHKLMEPKDPKP